MTMENSPRATRAQPARRPHGVSSPARRAAHQPVINLVPIVARPRIAAGIGRRKRGRVNLQAKKRKKKRRIDHGGESARVQSA